MKMKDNDYPAFPSDTEAWGPIGGMTLRDYFAAKAMQGMLANDIGWTGQYENCAQTAYRMAEAMLEARLK